eukprot:2863-Heterococcus_DN1.PRE.3
MPYPSRAALVHSAAVTAHSTIVFKRSARAYAESLKDCTYRYVVMCAFHGLSLWIHYSAQSACYGQSKVSCTCALSTWRSLTNVCLLTTSVSLSAYSNAHWCERKV